MATTHDEAPKALGHKARKPKYSNIKTEVAK